MRSSSSTILKLVLAFLLSHLFFISLLLPILYPFQDSDKPMFAEWGDIAYPNGDSISVADSVDEVALYVPVSTTMIISDTFFNLPYIIGPGPDNSHPAVATMFPSASRHIPSMPRWTISASFPKL